MHTLTRRKMFCLASLAFMTGCATAGGGAFTGTFEGTGRQCWGSLLVRNDTIALHTPFAKCGTTHYTIISQALGRSRPKIVFLLKADPTCDFGVISLEQDPAYPGYWNATGYRSESDYRKGSNDSLLCNLTRKSW